MREKEKVEKASSVSHRSFSKNKDSGSLKKDGSGSRKDLELPKKYHLARA